VLDAMVRAGYMGADEKPTERNRTRAGRESLKFSVYKTPQNGYSLYLCKAANGTQVAVGFWPDPNQKSTAEKALNACLDSLAFGADANSAREQWRRMAPLRRK